MYTILKPIIEKYLLNSNPSIIFKIMKKLVIYLSISVFACSPTPKTSSSVYKDSTNLIHTENSTTTPPQHTITDQKSQNELVAIDTNLLVLTKEILTSLKNKDYNTFVGYVHPSLGVRFSPYAYIDTIGHQKLSATELLATIDKNEIRKWGEYDGTGEPINLTFQKYLERFIYNADYLNAEKVSANEYLGFGNSLNNLSEIYPNCDFTESYFSGFEKKYDGMDWCTLRLVFKKLNGRQYLIAVVHDEWTI